MFNTHWASTFRFFSQFPGRFLGPLSSFISCLIQNGLQGDLRTVSRTLLSRGFRTLPITVSRSALRFPGRFANGFPDPFVSRFANGFPDSFSHWFPHPSHNGLLVCSTVSGPVCERFPGSFFLPISAPYPQPSPGLFYGFQAGSRTVPRILFPPGFRTVLTTVSWSVLWFPGRVTNGSPDPFSSRFPHRTHNGLLVCSMVSRPGHERFPGSFFLPVSAPYPQPSPGLFFRELRISHHSFSVLFLRFHNSPSVI